jgi:hypothetical protein
MWAFLSARLRTWLIMVILAPLAGRLLGRIGDLIEGRRGPNTLSRLLHGVSSVLGGPRRSARRRAADPAGVADPGVPAR